MTILSTFLTRWAMIVIAYGMSMVIFQTGTKMISSLNILKARYLVKALTSVLQLITGHLLQKAAIGTAFPIFHGLMILLQIFLKLTQWNMTPTTSSFSQEMM